MTNNEKYKNFDDIKCLWMKCGSVDYRICDNNYECDNCVFEKIMLSKLNRNFNINEELEGILDHKNYIVSFSHPYYHFKCGLLVRNFIGNNYYLGLEPFTTKFIDKNSILSYKTDNKIIEKDEPILSIKNGWGSVNILSPFTFTFIERFDLKNIFSNDKNWFAIIETQKDKLENNAINEKSYYDKFFRIKSYLKESLIHSDTVGTTMYDGGTPVVNWSELIGKKGFRELIKRLFS